MGGCRISCGFHQLGITVALALPLSPHLGCQHFPDLVQIAVGWVQAITPQAFVLVHEASSPAWRRRGSSEPPITYVLLMWRSHLADRVARKVMSLIGL